MDSGDYGVIGFWVFTAAAVVASSWSRSRREAEKHETLRRIVEKTGTIDEAKLQELFKAPTEPQSRPGGGYRALRITGTIIMFAGAVPALFGIVAAMFGEKSRNPPPPDFAIGMLSIAACVLVLGLGVFYSSRFAEPPQATRNYPPAI